MNLEAFRKHTQIHEQKLSYLDVGQGPVILMGHSYLWDNAMWHPQIECLSKHYRCIVPDLWGHGQSDAPPSQTSSLRDVADDMLVLMDNLNIEHFSILGLSVGGMWGSELALKAPTRVKSLVMMNSFIGFEPEVTREKYFGMLNTIAEVRHVPAPMIEAITPLFFGDKTAQEKPELIDSFKQRLGNIDDNNVDAIVKVGRMTFGRRDTTEDAHLLTLPCLIMAGVQDKARSVLESFLMHDVIDGSEQVNIDDAGHISALEQADVINAKLSAFFSQHLA